MNLKRHHVLYILLALSLMIALSVFVAPGVSGLSYRANTKASSAQIQNQASEVPSQSFKYEVVTSEASQEQGLSGRSEIPQNYGMLFAFAEEKKVGIWMKGMLTSIDIIWLSDNGTIIGIESNVSPDTYPKQIFYPSSPVKFVLETRVGEAQRQGWKVGTRIELPLLGSS